MEELKLSSTEICESFQEGEKLVREITKSIDMKLLLQKIKVIKDEINQLEKIIDSNKKILDKYSDKLSELSEEYKDKRIEIISLNLKEVFILISNNLPIGVVGEINDEGRGLILKREHKGFKNNKEVINYEDIGKIIRMNTEQNKFKVILNGENIKKYEEEFELDSLARTYKIVTFINTNISYKE